MGTKVIKLMAFFLLFGTDEERTGISKKERKKRRMK
jgi:hypothetical protein